MVCLWCKRCTTVSFSRIENDFMYEIFFREITTGFCSTKTTLYVILGVIGFLVLAIIIIVPVVVGNLNKSSSG